MSSTDDTNRWAILVLVGLAQLMVVLDTTIVNVALPSAQDELGFSDDARQWAITAYALAFGSLLLLGGKLGDLLGRKWTFTIGLLGFAIASALGGLAGSFGVLVGARALQGAFGALLAPSALGLLTVTFAGSPDRNKAFGIFSAIAGSGASIGLILGGVLSDGLSWRWCLWVNLFIAIPLAAAAVRVLAHNPAPHRPHLDLRGVALVSSGFFALVFGFSSAETNGWGSPATFVALAASVVLLVGFVLVERRVADPLLPLHVPRDRARGGAYASIAILGAGLFSVFLFLSFYLQRDLGFTPLQTGLGFLPMTAMIVTTATTVQTRILPRLGSPKPVVMTGMALATVGMLLLTRLSPDGTYAGQVLPGLILTGLGAGSIFAPAFSTATLGVDAREAGVASALVNTSQQIGGSVGTALLSTIFAGAVGGYADDHGVAAGSASAAIHGYTVGFGWAAALFATGFLIAATVLPGRPRRPAVAPTHPIAVETAA